MQTQSHYKLFNSFAEHPRLEPVMSNYVKLLTTLELPEAAQLLTEVMRKPVTEKNNCLIPKLFLAIKNVLVEQDKDKYFNELEELIKQFDN